MYEKVLTGFDGSPESNDALHLARALAEPDDWSLTLAGIVERDPIGPSPRLREGEGIAEAQRLSALARAELGERRFETHVAAGSPARVLSELARKRRADLVAVGSAHRGQLGRVLAGSVAESLTRGAPCPVAVAPRGFARREHAGLGLVAVGYDGTEASKRALREAERLAAWLDAQLRVVTVIPELSPSRAVYVPALREHFDAALAALASGMASLSGDIEAEPDLATGDPAAVLAAHGVEADLLVIGSRGHGPLRRALLGGVSAAVMRTAPCPVIVVPRSAGAVLGETFEPQTENVLAVGI